MADRIIKQGEMSSDIAYMAFLQMLGMSADEIEKIMDDLILKEKATAPCPSKCK